MADARPDPLKMGQRLLGILSQPAHDPGPRLTLMTGLKPDETPPAGRAFVWGSPRLPLARGRLAAVHCRFPGRRVTDLATLAQVLAAGLARAGQLTVQDIIVPGTRLRGRKRRETEAAAAYLNAFFALLDPWHAAYCSPEAWENLLTGAGLVITHRQLSWRMVDLTTWIGPAGLAPDDHWRVRALLRQAPGPAAAYLTPQIGPDRIAFRLEEITLGAELRSGGGPN